MTTGERLTIDELIENFEFLGDWEQRFTYLIDLGKTLPTMSEVDMNEVNRVHGCQATVYLKASFTAENTIDLIATSNAHIVNGLIAVLLSLYNFKTAPQIMAIDPLDALKKLGLEEHLSPTRRNGLHAMLKRVRELATANL